MLVDPEQVRNGEIDGTEKDLPEQTRRAIDAYHLASAREGGATSIANLIQTLFELYPATAEQIASESGMLANLSANRIQRIREGLAEDVLYTEIAEICRVFEVDFAYLEYPRATQTELEPLVARARAFRAENPHLEPNDILREHLLDYGRRMGISVMGLVNTLCREVFSGVHVPNPDDVQAFLTGLDIRPEFLDAAAGDLLGYPYEAWRELWSSGWWRNDLRP